LVAAAQEVEVSGDFAEHFEGFAGVGVGGGGFR
jgi:hypothetical protein